MRGERRAYVRVPAAQREEEEEEERGKRREGGREEKRERPRSIVTSNESNGGRAIVDVSGIFIRRGRNGWKKPRSRFFPTSTTTTTTHANLIKRIKAGSVHACYRMNRILLRPTEFGDRTD